MNGDLLIFNMPVTLVNVALSLSNPTLTVSGLYNPAFSGAYDIKVRLSDSAGAILVDTVNSFEASDVKTSLNIVPLTTISKNNPETNEIVKMILTMNLFLTHLPFLLVH